MHGTAPRPASQVRLPPHPPAHQYVRAVSPPSSSPFAPPFRSASSLRALRMVVVDVGDAQPAKCPPVWPNPTPGSHNPHPHPLPCVNNMHLLQLQLPATAMASTIFEHVGTALPTVRRPAPPARSPIVSEPKAKPSITLRILLSFFSHPTCAPPSMQPTMPPLQPQLPVTSMAGGHGGWRYWHCTHGATPSPPTSSQPGHPLLCPSPKPSPTHSPTPPPPSISLLPVCVAPASQV